MYIFFGKIYSGFTISLNSVAELVYSQSLAILFTNAILYIITWLLTRHFPNILPMLVSILVEIIISIIWSGVAHKLYFRKYAAIRTAVIYDMRPGVDKLIESYGLSARFNVVSNMYVFDVLKNMEEALGDVGAIFLCGVHSHERNQIIKYCVEKKIRVYLIPNIGDLIMESASPVHMLHLPMLMVERYNPTPDYLIIKRAFDIFSSGIALVILSPLMIIIGLLIRSDGGTAFYRQKRLTKDGKEFYVLKFRSMRMDAEKDGVARLSTGENDDRITPIGHFIRACRIDELPQLINIFKGEMSVVGPRPERPEIAAQYEEELPASRKISRSSSRQSRSSLCLKAQRESRRDRPLRWADPAGARRRQTLRRRRILLILRRTGTLIKRSRIHVDQRQGGEARLGWKSILS